MSDLGELLRWLRSLPHYEPHPVDQLPELPPGWRRLDVGVFAYRDTRSRVTLSLGWDGSKIWSWRDPEMQWSGTAPTMLHAMCLALGVEVEHDGGGWYWSNRRRGTRSLAVFACPDDAALAVLMAEVMIWAWPDPS